MKGLKGTKSEENVKIAFAGESQARSKYIYFAEAARKEGNEKMAELFERWLPMSFLTPGFGLT